MRNRKEEPSLLKKLIDIHHEEAMAKKALRILSKQEWSVDFLCLLCAKAAKLSGSPVEITVQSPAKQTVSIKSQDISAFAAAEDNILDKLDDVAAVESFIRKHSTR